MAQIGGTAFLRIDGVAYSSDGKFECKINDVKRDPVPDSTGFVHYTESVVASTISGSILALPGLQPEVINQAENVTVQIELKNGRIALLANAFHSGELTESTETGLIQFEFTGKGRWL